MLSMTIRLGLATVLGAIAVVILAHSKDQIPITDQCKAGSCAVSAKTAQVERKKVPKAGQYANGTTDRQPLPRKTEKSMQALGQIETSETISRRKDRAMLDESADTGLTKNAVAITGSKSLGKKPDRRLVKKPPQLLVESLPEVQIEKPRDRRARREDDPFIWQN